MKKKFNLNSVKFKLTVLPLFILFLSFSLFTAFSCYMAKVSTIQNVKENGLLITRQIAKSIEQSSNAYKVLNEQIEDKIKLTARVVMNQPSINNDVLKNIANTIGVDEINFTDNSGKIIYSNLQSSIGYVFSSKDASYPVISGSKNDLMEKIRKSAKGNDYYKYGCVHNPKGGMIQVGINANKVQELYNKTSYQSILDKLSNDPDIVYALFIDKNLKIVAHTDKSRIGIQLTDEGSKQAVLEGKEFADEYYYDIKKITVFDVLTPVYIDGNLIGAINVGLSMEPVYASVSKTLRVLLSIGLLSFILVASVLYIFSKSAVLTLSDINSHLSLMSEGDLSVNLKSNLLRKTDEFGNISKALDILQKVLKEIVNHIKTKSEKIGNASNSLLETSREMAAGSQQVAATITEIAKGAQTQAEEISDVVDLMQNLAQNMDNIYTKLKTVKDSAEDTKQKVNVGKEELNLLLDSIENIKKSFNMVNDKIQNLSNSISKVGSITDAITTIAEQTNLLALNAAIEAARAGESGRGFAVVAEEVRKLAEESRQFADDIKNLVLSIDKDATEVTDTAREVDLRLNSQIETVDHTVKSFEDILNSVEAITPSIEEVYNSVNLTVNVKDSVLSKTENVSAIIEESTASTEEISASSEQISASTQEVAESIENLNAISEELLEYVSKFKL
ncbi:MAG: methyl-accepting chemotaxis protein [Caloramator sp.]|nr:methyl-accepting chemotaxis protein [Caloramator sp.]